MARSRVARAVRTRRVEGRAGRRARGPRAVQGPRRLRTPCDGASTRSQLVGATFLKESPMAAIARFGTRVVPEKQQIVQECRDRKQLVQGPHIEAFEEEFANMLGSGHVRTCSTEYGRMALYFILKAMDLPPGSEVIVPALTFWVVPEIVRVAGLKPVFADIDPATFTLSPG